MTEPTRIAFRADASEQAGSGHLMRCLALADGVRARGARTRFLCRALPPALAAAVRGSGHELAILAGSPGLDPDPSMDAAATNAALADAASWDWLVVDHYGLDERWETAARATAGRILVLDDFPGRRHDADLLLDPALHPVGARPYAGLLPAACRVLLGPAFALLRGEFRDRAPPGAREGFRVNVAFGGTDPGGMTLRALRALKIWGEARSGIDVVLGSASPHLRAVADACARLPGAELHVDATHVAELLGRARLGIGAGGGSSWERCRMGLPALMVSVAPNQRPNCRALHAARAALCLGDQDDVTSESLAALLAALAARPRLLDRMGKRAAALVDGRGVERLAILLLRGPITFRRAVIADARRAWSWRDHPSTRRFSIDPAPVPWSTHERWWSGSVASATRILLVARASGSDLGVLRYDLEGPTATVSIYLDPGLAGLGLGSAVLRAGAAWLSAHEPSVRRIHAVILPENVASIRSFSSAGYRPTGTGKDWSLDLRESPGARAREK
jgi:UDP-2,4-diacetamido-2,4,6-trideoxy-beta-L-altropyranose hydrolase